MMVDSDEMYVPINEDDIWNCAIEAALRAAKRGFNSKSKIPVKLKVYDRIKKLRKVSVEEGAER